LWGSKVAVSEDLMNSLGLSLFADSPLGDNPLGLGFRFRETLSRGAVPNMW